MRELVKAHKETMASLRTGRRLRADHLKSFAVAMRMEALRLDSTNLDATLRTELRKHRRQDVLTEMLAIDAAGKVAAFKKSVGISDEFGGRARASATPQQVETHATTTRASWQRPTSRC